MIYKTFMTPAELWQKCKAKAHSRGQSISWIIRQLLQRWLDGKIDL